MNLKTTLILLAFLALAVAALLLTRGGDNAGPIQTDAERPHAADREAILDPTLLGAGLKRVVITEGEGIARLTLSRESGRWWVTHPHRYPANNAAVDELLTLVGNLRGMPGDDPGTFSTDQPELILEHDNRRIVIDIQPRTGAGRARLGVWHGEAEAFYEADDTLRDVYDALNPQAFFAKTVDLPPMPETGRIEIIADSAQSVLIRKDGRWWIGEGEAAQRAWARGEPGYPGVQDYFDLAKQFKIVEHIPYDQQGLGAFGLDRPLISARFVEAAGTAGDPAHDRTLTIGVAADPQDQTRYASFGQTGDPRPAVFTLPTPFALAFGQAGTAFRDPRVVSTPARLIGTLNLTPPGSEARTITLGLDGTAELEVANGQSDVLSAAACAAMLESLTRARASSYVEDGLDTLDPLTVVEVLPRLDGEPESFIIYADPQSEPGHATVLVRRGQEPVALRIDQASVAALLDPSALEKNAE